jgi:Flp pilus assembly protein TadB
MAIRFVCQARLLSNLEEISGDGISNGEENGINNTKAMPRRLSVVFIMLMVTATYVTAGAMPAAAFAVIYAVATIIQRVRAFVARKRRELAFEQDLVPYLLSVAASTRAGQDPLTAALQGTNRDGYSKALQVELEGVSAALSQGASEAEAFAQFGRSVFNSDCALFSAAFLVSRREGGGLASFCKRLSRVVRRRQAFRRKARAAVAMQRLSAMGIAGCCCLMLLFQWATNLEGLTYALETVPGKVLIGFGSLLLLSGIAWLFQLTQKSEW